LKNKPSTSSRITNNNAFEKYSSQNHFTDDFQNAKKEAFIADLVIGGNQKSLN